MAYYYSDTRARVKKPVKIVTWADGTDEEILAMIYAHDAGEIDITEIWNVGDTRVCYMNGFDDIHDTYSFWQGLPSQEITFTLLAKKNSKVRVSQKRLSSSNTAYTTDQNCWIVGVSPICHKKMIYMGTYPDDTSSIYTQYTDVDQITYYTGGYYLNDSDYIYPFKYSLDYNTNIYINNRKIYNYILSNISIPFHNCFRRMDHLSWSAYKVDDKELNALHYGGYYGQVFQPIILYSLTGDTPSIENRYADEHGVELLEYFSTQANRSLGSSNTYITGSTKSAIKNESITMYAIDKTGATTSVTLSVDSTHAKDIYIPYLACI
jgi:hypothetical protein